MTGNGIDLLNFHPDFKRAAHYVVSLIFLKRKIFGCNFYFRTKLG